MRASVGWPPKQTIPVLADNCSKCGRPLSSPASRRARVGTTCIQIYGANPKDIQNPEYVTWLAKKERADATYRRLQDQFDREYAKASSTHADAVLAFREAKKAHRAAKRAQRSS